jgi:hypothetical protein
MEAELPPSISHTPEFKLDLATEKDILEITEVWYTCFPEPFIRQMFPYIPSVIQWWNDANSYDMANKPYIKFLVVRDVSTEGKGRIVGYAKWWVPIGEKGFTVEERFPKWGDESDMELCNTFFSQLAKERAELMRDKQYYCEFALFYLQILFCWKLLKISMLITDRSGHAGNAT